jgi:hypothetical protein
MTSDNDPTRPGELTDAQLDRLLEAANDELLGHVQATADSSVTLTAIMADSTTTPGAGRRAAAPARNNDAVVTISQRARAHDLDRALNRARAMTNAFQRRHQSDRHTNAHAPSSPGAYSVPLPADSFFSRIAAKPRRLRRYVFLSCMIAIFALYFIFTITSGTAFLFVFRAIHVTGGTAITDGFFFGYSDAGLISGVVLAILLIFDVCVRRLKGALNNALALERVIRVAPVIPARAHPRRIAIAFGFARALDRIQVRMLTNALVHAADRGTVSRDVYDLAGEIARALNRIQLLARPAEVQSVDASGADLSRVKIRDLVILDRVVWTQQTIWPPGIADHVREESDKIGEGLYQVRIGNTNDRTGLTRV